MKKHLVLWLTLPLLSLSSVPSIIEKQTRAQNIDYDLVKDIFGYNKPSEENCRSNNLICSNNGECQNGICKCKPFFSGKYCNTNSQKNKLCLQSNHCVKCMGFYYHMNTHEQLEECIKSCISFKMEKRQDLDKIVASDESYSICKIKLKPGCIIIYAASYLESKPYIIPSDPYCKFSEFTTSDFMEEGQYIGFKSKCSESTGVEKPHGFGFLTYEEKDSFQRTLYQGEWFCGLRHGRGVLCWKNGSCYWGDFIHGVRNGRGVMMYANKDIYIGHWSNNVKHGNGSYLWSSSGDIYDGHFINGVREGYGKYNWEKNKTYFAGAFSEDEIKEGKFIFSNNDTFKGNQNFGLYSEGCSGNTYNGNFVDGHFKGKGTYSWVNGLTYTGDFSNSEPNGIGEYKIDVFTIKGEFRNGKLIHSDDECINFDSLSKTQSYIKCTLLGQQHHVLRGRHPLVYTYDTMFINQIYMIHSLSKSFDEGLV